MAPTLLISTADPRAPTTNPRLCSQGTELRRRLRVPTSSRSTILFLPTAPSARSTTTTPPRTATTRQRTPRTSTRLTTSCPRRPRATTSSRRDPSRREPHGIVWETCWVTLTRSATVRAWDRLDSWTLGGTTTRMGVYRTSTWRRSRSMSARIGTSGSRSG